MPELAFNIDKQRSESDVALAIAIQLVEKEGFALSFLNKQPLLTASTIKNLAKDNEKDVVALLIQEELKFLRRTTGKPHNEASLSVNIVHVAYPQSVQVLKLLAATGKLYYNKRQLAADFFSKTEFYFFAESDESENIGITGRLKIHDQNFDIRDCDFVSCGPPHWYIKGISLKLIGTDVLWKHLKAAYQQAPLPGSFIQRELEEDPEGPKIVFAGNSKDKFLQKREPLPLLILKDRLGAFADLWMDYDIKKIGSRVAYDDPNRQITDSNGTVICQRIIEAEKSWEKDLLETDYIRKSVDNSHYYCPLDKVAKSLSFLLELGWNILDWKGNHIEYQSDLNMDVHDSANAILVKGKVKYGNHEANLAEVAGSFNRRERFIQIAPGIVGLLPQDWRHSPLGTLLEEGEIISEGIKVKKSRIGSLSELLDSPATTIADNALKNLYERLKSQHKIEASLPGNSFKGTLRLYQQEGLNWLSFLYENGLHGILSDDMGLGKTVQALAFLSRIKFEAPVLIVMPTSLIFNWKHEIEQFLPGFDVIIHHGPNRIQEQLQLDRRTIILTSYTTLRLDLNLFSPIQFQCVIIDEAQAIKNPQTQTAQAIFSLKSRFRLSISGTPIENHPNEIWSQFRFLIPDLLGSQEEFASEIQAGTLDSRYLQRIKRKIRPFVLRRKKEDVAKDLPEKIEQVVWVEMEPSQRQIYDDFLAGVQGNLFKKIQLEGISKHRMEILEAILRLRQICCHPLLISSQLSTPNGQASAKMDALLQDMETAIEEGRKALVYSQFTQMLALIGKEAQKRGWKYAYLDGSTTNRENVVMQFQEDPATPLFLISLKAGGIGLNLTAADYVLLYDPWWNDAVENQAINRAHRIGRHETVFAKRYIAVASIEEKIMKLKSVKSSMIADIMDSDLALPTMTEEDLLFLLS